MKRGHIHFTAMSLCHCTEMKVSDRHVHQVLLRVYIAEMKMYHVFGFRGY